MFCQWMHLATRRLPLALSSFAAAATLSASAPPARPLFETDFNHSDGVLARAWHLEGTGEAKVREGALSLQEDPDGVGVVLWTRQDWPADLRLSFDLSFSNNRGIGVIFLAAKSSDGSDALQNSVERTGAYDEYTRGDLDSYSLSLHRYWPDGRNNPGSNLRRNRGFHLLNQALPDPCLEAGQVYRVEIRKEGPVLTVWVDGTQTHHAVDDGKHGTPLGRGKIGFRLRGDASCVMRIDNIQLSEL